MSIDSLSPTVLGPSTTRPDRRSVPLPVRMADEPNGVGGWFRPDHATIEYHRWPGQSWVARVFLSGYRICAATGEPGQTWDRRCYHHPDDAFTDDYPSRLPIPAFLMPFVAQYHPDGDQ